MWCRDGRGRGDQEERRPNKWRWIRWILSFKCLKEIIKVYGNVLTWTEQTCWCMETEQCVLWQHWRHRPHLHMVPASGHHPHWSPEHLSSVCVVSSEHSWAPCHCQPCYLLAILHTLYYNLHPLTKQTHLHLHQSSHLSQYQGTNILCIRLL